jgi:hypothetical protein
VGAAVVRKATGVEWDLSMRKGYILDYDYDYDYEHEHEHEYEHEYEHEHEAYADRNLIRS